MTGFFMRPDDLHGWSKEAPNKEGYYPVGFIDGRQEIVKVVALDEGLYWLLPGVLLSKSLLPWHLTIEAWGPRIEMRQEPREGG